MIIDDFTNQYIADHHNPWGESPSTNQQPVERGYFFTALYEMAFGWSNCTHEVFIWWWLAASPDGCTLIKPWRHFAKLCNRNPLIGEGGEHVYWGHRNGCLQHTLGVDMQTNGFNVSFPDCIWMVDRPRHAANYFLAKLHVILNFSFLHHFGQWK